MELSSGTETAETFSYKTDLKSQYIIPVGNKEGLFLNPYSFGGKEIRFERTKDDFMTKKKGHPGFDAFNVVLGSLTCSPKNGHVIYANRVEPEVEIFDSDGKLIRRLKFHDERLYEPQQYYTDKGHGTDSYCFLGKVKQSFIDACGSDDCIALLFRPGVITPTSTAVSAVSYIIVFDWNGDNVRGCSLNENISTISLSSDGKSLYCFSSSEQGKQLIKYYLDNE